MKFPRGPATVMDIPGLFAATDSWWVDFDPPLHREGEVRPVLSQETCPEAIARDASREGVGGNGVRLGLSFALPARRKGLSIWARATP